MKTYRFALTVIALIVSLWPTATAQDATGRILGIVTDATGAVVPSAHVTVMNTATALTRDTMTAEDGSYQVLSLPIGNYTVSVDRTGFRKTITAPQQLNINNALRLDVKLEVGATTDTVQVEAKPS